MKKLYAFILVLSLLSCSQVDSNFQQPTQTELDSITAVARSLKEKQDSLFFVNEKIEQKRQQDSFKRYHIKPPWHLSDKELDEITSLANSEDSFRKGLKPDYEKIQESYYRSVIEKHRKKKEREELEKEALRDLKEDH